MCEPEIPFNLILYEKIMIEVLGITPEDIDSMHVGFERLYLLPPAYPVVISKNIFFFLSLACYHGNTHFQHQPSVDCNLSLSCLN